MAERCLTGPLLRAGPIEQQSQRSVLEGRVHGVSRQADLKK
jgi:hypothetical protein